MEFSRQFVSSLLVALLIFGSGQISLVMAQPAQTGQDRPGGGSFGAYERKSTVPLLPPSPSSYVLPEPAPGSVFYQIHVLGEINGPGTYRVTASTRLSEVLRLAGGILERGSERRIELRRREEGTRKIDLLSYNLSGNLDANPYLMDNDIIFVPLRHHLVEIEGAIQRPGTYELKNEKTLEDIIHLAGGFTSGVDTPSPIKVIRFDQRTKKIIDVENKAEERRGFRLENADVIVVPHLLTEGKKFDYSVSKLPGDRDLFYPSYEERVFVLGAVANPGPYPFSPNYNLREYLTLAGGTSRLAKTGRIKIIGPEGKTMKGSHAAEINPGDTIVVPEKYMAPESFVSLILAFATSVLGITTTVLTLTR